MRVLLCIPHGIPTPCAVVRGRITPLFRRIATPDLTVDVIANGTLPDSNPHYRMAHASRSYRDNFAACAREIPGADLVVISKSIPYYAIPVWLCARRHRKRVLIDCDDYEAFGQLRGIPTWPFYPGERLVMRACPHVVASRYLEEVFGGVYIPNSAELDAQPPPFPNPDRQGILRSFGELPADGVIFSYVTTITPQSGLDALFRIFEELPEGSPLHLVVAGDGHAFARYRQRAERSHGRIVMAGWLSHARVAQLYAVSDAGLIPFQDTRYTRAKSPIKLYEYMAMAVPILTTSVGESALKVRQSGCGFIAADGPLRREDFERVGALSPAERHAVGRRGRQFLEQEQSWDLLAERYRGVLRSVAAGKNGA